jgi:hypothetical protein
MGLDAQGDAVTARIFPTGVVDEITGMNLCEELARAPIPDSWSHSRFLSSCWCRMLATEWPADTGSLVAVAAPILLA